MGASNAIAVSPGQLEQFGIIGVANPTAGVPFTLTVAAEDRYGNVEPNYSGTVHFASSNTVAMLPADSTLASGMGSFSAMLQTATLQAITATDKASTGITGSASFIPNPGPATHFAFYTDGRATAGIAFSITVNAEDQFNDAATGYAGTVHFTSGDSLAGLPSDMALTSGAGNLAVTLRTAGTEIITATDLAANTITGSGTVNISANVAARFTVTAALPNYQGITSGLSTFATTGLPISVTVTAVDLFGNAASPYGGTVQITSGDTAAVLPANATVAGGLGTFSATLMTAGNQTITATDLVSGITTPTSLIPTPRPGGHEFCEPRRPDFASLSTSHSIPARS